MASDSFFLTKTTVPQDSMLIVAGNPAVEQYRALADLLFARGGRSVAALFAEPVLSKGNGSAPSTVSWYTGFAGEGVRLSSLQAKERQRVEDLLRQRLGQAKGLLDDPANAPLLGAALHVLEAKDVWVVDGQPVIVNWGMLSDDAQRSQSSRDAHFAATLGPYLPLPSAPPLSAAEWQEQASAPADGSATSRDSATSDSTAGPAGTHDLGRQAAAGAAAAATMMMPQSGDTAATTVLMASGGTPTDGEEAPAEEEKKRSPWTWPLIVLIAILAIVLIGTIIALALNNGSAQAPPSTSTSAPPSSPPPTSDTPTPEPTDSTVQINQDDYLGLTVDNARAGLEALGMSVNAVEGNAATDPADAGTVYAVNPTGPVEQGSQITITYYADPVAPSAPSSAPTVNPATTAPNTDVQVSWPGQNCPAGQTLTGYEVAVTGDASIPNNAVVGASTTSATVRAGTSDFEVTYRYFCGPLDSPFSPPAQVTVQAATSTPAP